MSSPFRFTFPGGRIVDNAATLGAVATVSFTVPAGKRWLVLAGYIERDVNDTLDVEYFNSSDKQLGRILDFAAQVINVTFGPGYHLANIHEQIASPIPLRAGDYVKVTWGQAQITPEVSLTVMEIDE